MSSFKAIVIRKSDSGQSVALTDVGNANNPRGATSSATSGSARSAVHSRPDATSPAPRGPAEEEVASVWGAVLGLERVGAHDNFFDIGGHSLLATQVVSRLRDAFGVPLVRCTIALSM